MAASYKLFDSFEEWVVRFPSTLSFLLIVLLHFIFGKRYLKRDVALLGALFFLGGAVTQNFALILMAGVLAGTYSSIFLANPLLITIAEWQQKKNKNKNKKK